jgi:hypothetical protein
MTGRSSKRPVLRWFLTTRTAPSLPSGSTSAITTDPREMQAWPPEAALATGSSGPLGSAAAEAS